MAKSKHQKQKLYKMKGCSKKTRKNKHLGGSSISAADVNLAYPANNIHTVPNPYLAYTGKGGSCDKSAYPNVGPRSGGFNFLNSQPQGGGCGCGSMNGGGKKKGFMIKGVRHRLHCKCSHCKSKKSVKMKGGNGASYPNGIVGDPWTPNIGGWPGVKGDGNYLELNTYNKDPTRQMIGGNKKRTKKQRGGTLSNFLGQDLLNLGRQFNFGVGSAYNTLSGYSSPVNPMPWKDQLHNGSNLNALKAAYI